MAAENWSQILNSLHKVAMGEEDISMDLNIATRGNDTVLLYVRNYQELQVLHKISDSDSTTVDINEPTQLVFDSQVLRDVVQSAGKQDIDLRFGDHDFDVEIGQESFDSSTEFTLRLVQDTEFQKPLNIDGYERIVDVSRTGLLENLKMFTSVSKVVDFDIKHEELIISVSDKVQGSGKLVVNIEDAPFKLNATYPIRPLKDFLQKMKTDQVSIHMTPSRTIKLESNSGEKVSSIHRSQRL
ncbi:hypothetical protein ACOZ4F_14165 [Haloarcula marismortui]|uniref:hypothetical protein n=1 Tax=Haloarcula marismortui TaxID=2238 RepID=UPI003C765060